MCARNVYHRHKAYPDVKGLEQNVYQPQIAFPVVKTHVQNV